MKVKARKLLSLVLSLAMVMGMLVLPASAAENPTGVFTINFSDYSSAGSQPAATTADSYFTLVYRSGSSNDSISAQSATYGTAQSADYLIATHAFRTNGVSKFGLKDGQVDTASSERLIGFTTTNDDATVKVWIYDANGDRDVILNDNTGTPVKIDGVEQKYTTVKADKTSVATFTTGKAGTYWISTGNGLRIHQVRVTDKAAAAGEGQSTLAFVVPEGITVDTVKVAGADNNFTTSGKDKSLFAAIGAAVTFKLTPSKGYTVSSVTAGEGALTPDAQGVYSVTMPGEGETTTVTITAAADLNPATKVELDVATAELKVGGTKTLTATTTAQDTSKDCTDTVAWSSSNENVATVENGVITPKTIGQTTITAEANESASATCTVAVVGANQTGDTYVFESKKMAAATSDQLSDVDALKYDNYFTVLVKNKIDSSNKTWSGEDSYSSGLRINFNGAATTTENSVKFTTSKAATVKVWWAANKNDYQMTMLNGSGAAVTGAPTTGSVAANTAYVSTFEAPKSDTYYVGGATAGNYVFKIEVVEKNTVENITLTHGYTEDGGTGDGHTIYAGGTGGQGGKTWVDDTTKLYPGSWKMDVTVEPAEADQGVIWSVEAAEGETECPITVDQNGVVSPVAGKLGTGVVVATAKGDTTKVAHCDVIVAPYITGVTIGETNPTTTMGVAAAARLKLTATLDLAGDITVSQLSEGQDDITWASSDTSVLTVNSSTGVVTPVKAGKANVTATTEKIGPRAEAKTATVEVTVNKGTLNMGVSVDSDTQPAIGGTAVVTVTGIRPNGDLDNVSVTAQAAGGQVITGTNGTEVNQWNVELPANTESTPVEYTITVAYNGTNWAASSKTATVTVAAAGEKTLTVTLTTAGNATEIEEDGSLVITAAAKLDGEATNDVTYQWKKDGTDISGATSATLTVNEAGSYTCTVTGTGEAAGLTKTSSPVTITVKKPALQSISATLKEAVDGVTYTPGETNNLVINGKKTVVFNVTMNPAENDDTLETDLEVVDGLELVSATYDATAKTLTVTPKRASVNENVPRTLTLKGTEHSDVKWEVKIAVKKLPAPAVLASADVTTTAPTAAGGKGTITIANTVAGKTYGYKAVPTTGSAADANQASTGWTNLTAAGAIVTFTNVAPGKYMVREKVDAAFQNIPGSVQVTVGNYVAPIHSIAVDGDMSDGTVEVDEEAAEGSTVTVTVIPGDGYRVKKLCYVKDGETAETVITKTGGVYSFTMPDKDITIYVTFEEGEPEPDTPTSDFDATKLTFSGADEQVTAADFKEPFSFTGTVLKKLNKAGDTVTSIDVKRGDGSAFVITIPEGKVGDLSAKLCSTSSSNSSAFALKNASTGADIAEDANKSTASGGTGTAETFTWAGLKAGTYHIYCPSGSSNLRVVTAHVDFKDAQGTVTPGPDEPVKVTGVSLDTNELELDVGEEVDLTATVVPANATDKTVTWTSSDASKVTVDANGKVTAVAAGSATITVTTTDGGKTATCDVTVLGSGSGPVETTKVLDANTMTVEDHANGADTTVAGYFTVKWGDKGKVDASSATFDGDTYEGTQRVHMGGKTNNLDGRVINFKTTSANATVKIWYKTGKAGTNKTPEARNIAVFKGSMDAIVGQSSHTAEDEDKTFIATYTLADPATYSVGIVGNTCFIYKIEVTETTTSGSTVKVTDVTLDKATASIAEGDTVKLTATIAPTNATNKKLSWSTSDPAVATVANDGTVTAVKAGTATIKVTTVSGAKTATCAVTVTASGSVTPPTPSGNGGGSSSNVPSTGGGTTVTNPDGSKTNTKTNSSTGAVTETTTYPDGSKTVVVTEKDGTVTETVTKKDGSKTETVSKPDGSTTVAATDAKGIKTEVATSAAGEVSAKVTLPKNVDKTVVTIPVKDVTDGTVAVIVNANGTEQVIKTSMAGEAGLELLVDKNVSVKIKDNAKKFDDIEDGYWAKGAVDFVSSREIFKGVTETTFAPVDVVNRGMMATVLYRLADAKAEGENVFFDVADDSWYVDAVTWANRSGVVTGYADGTFGPIDAVTREQMATMLFRFAKVMKMDVSAKGDMSKFGDASEVSSWASEAMAWAVGVGLVNGVGDPAQGAILAPAKTASRAEVATLMQRMVKLMMQ